MAHLPQIFLLLQAVALVALVILQVQAVTSYGLLAAAEVQAELNMMLLKHFLLVVIQQQLAAVDLILL
jgi:hypothetical protein